MTHFITKYTLWGVIMVNMSPRTLTELHKENWTLKWLDEQISGLYGFAKIQMNRSLIKEEYILCLPLLKQNL